MSDAQADFEKDEWVFMSLHDYSADDPYFVPFTKGCLVYCACSVCQGATGPDGVMPSAYERWVEYDQENRRERLV